MALVDYDAGRRNIGTLYSNLSQAIADKGRAENLQKARQIEREGLFGTGISSSDLKGMSDVGLGIAEFGQGRMEKQMANAEKSFGRRQAADERRLATLQKRADLGDKKALDEMQGIQMGMSERRNAFEDKMGEYSGKGIWGTGFGSEEVGWRTKDKGAVGPESEWSTRMRNTPQTGGEEGGGQSRMALSADTEHMRGKTEFGQPMAPAAQSAPGGRSEYEDKHGMGTSPFTTSNFPGREGFLGNLGKKKDELGGGQVGTRANPEDTAHMRSRSEFSPPGSNKFEEKPSDMRMPGVLRNLTQKQRTRMDRLGRQRIEREDLAPLNTARADYNNQIQDTLKRRRNKKLSDLVAGLNLG